MGGLQLLLRLQGMLRVVEELVLQLFAGCVGLYGFDCFGDLARPGLLVEVAEFLRGRFAVAVQGFAKQIPDESPADRKFGGRR